ncbi:hypothetical protein SOVF_103470 [Spinacia oleracea]|uniref:Mechanosensitive ion channel protein n=1 Tax=Spinacia oleracea TaxID=3562 RepID=A0A9R0ILF6_SPIOL|nr:mechanosensitive ion channel protein 10-like [Spinacia oleracea]KNA14876.1 hypothetical protein SOVF_103470 [Spinacia oleracea]
MAGRRKSIDQVVVNLPDTTLQSNPSLPSNYSNANTINVELQGDQLKKHPQSISSLRKRATLRRHLSFSKPQSRNTEFNYIYPKKKVTKDHLKSNETGSGTTIWEEEKSKSCNGVDCSSTDSSLDEESEEEDTRIEEEEKLEGQLYHNIKKKKRKIHWKRVVELSIFFVILTCSIFSVTMHTLRNHHVKGLFPWWWCLLAMVVFSGRLCAGWLVSFLVFLIERNFMLREKVLYFVYGLRTSIQSCIWLALVLVAWTFMFDAKVHHDNRVVKRVSQLLVAILVAAIIWLVKIVMVKSLASSFHVRTYFDRMKESVFHHCILDRLSGPPFNELVHEEHKPILGSTSLPTKWKHAKNAIRSKKYGANNVDMEKLQDLSKETSASIWSLKRLMKHIRSSGLSPLSKNVYEFGTAEAEITSEWQARSTAKRIFKNVAKCGAKYIEEDDLSRFLKRNEIHEIFPLFEGALETGKITKSSFRNWVVRTYFERKALSHSLNDTKSAVKQLHKIASAIVSVIIFVVFLLLMGLASTKVVAFVVTQMVVLGVIFHNSCKIIFDCIIFVFVMHPFDIGDRCKVDGVQMIVEEMNILTTVFLRYDMEKIYYPNSALLDKPISNFYRSPDMWDTIPITIDMSTPLVTINALKKATQSYIDSKPNYWNSKHSFVVTDIEDLNKMKMGLSVQHTINHQNIIERNVRLHDLILDLKKNFEILGIKYHLLPQEVHLTQLNIDNPSPTVEMNNSI